MNIIQRVFPVFEKYHRHDFKPTDSRYWKKCSKCEKKKRTGGYLYV